MRSAWSAKRGRLAVAGTFVDVALHHHPAVQVSIGLGESMRLHTGDSPALSACLRSDTGPGAQLNQLCRTPGGFDRVWAVEATAGSVDQVEDVLGERT